MASHEHSFISPATCSSPSSPSSPQSAQQLAGESKAALVHLESVLEQRNQALGEHIKRQKQEKARENKKLEQKLQDERRNFAIKREQLWDEIDKGRMDLERKNEDVTRLEKLLNQQQIKCVTLQRRAYELEQKVQDHGASSALAINIFQAEMKKAKTKQEQLLQKMGRVEKRLKEQSAAFEQERARWQQGNIGSGRNVQTGMRLPLEWAVPHLRGLLDAYNRDQARVPVNANPQEAGAGQTQLAETVDLIHTEEATQHLAGQQNAFNQECDQLLEQASDATRTQHDISLRNLAEREGVLRCPISLELFADPVVTKCCGKTFSSDGLRQALRRSSLCPFCRATRVSFYPNRDVAKLVELHQAERSVLNLPELSASSPVAANHTERRPDTFAARTHRSGSSSGGRQSRNREHRSERVHTRSEVPHRGQMLNQHLYLQLTRITQQRLLPRPDTYEVLLQESHQVLR